MKVALINRRTTFISSSYSSVQTVGKEWEYMETPNFYYIL